MCDVLESASVVQVSAKKITGSHFVGRCVRARVRAIQSPKKRILKAATSALVV